MSPAIEAQTLALKMKAMIGRWNKYLPFHEVIDVKFDYWQALVSEWIEVLVCNPTEETMAKYPWIDGCKEYMLDLYALTEQLDEEGQLTTRAPQFYEVGIKDDYQREMTAYMECTDELLYEMEGDESWRTDIANMATYSLKDALISDITMTLSPDKDHELVEELERGVKSRFEALMTFEGIHACAVIALGSLQNQLCDLEALFNKALPNEMFIRLSTRLFYRHCLGSYREGEACVNKWQNGWPEDKLKKNSMKKKEEIKKQLMAKPYGAELQEYISMDAPNLFTDSCMGRFLFKNRHELTVDDLKCIHKLCREINLLNELIAHEVGSEVRIHAAPIRQLTAHEQTMLSELEKLAKKAEWENITEEAAITALHKALGLGSVFADKALVEQSQILWQLLQKRRGCNTEKSLMVTWLNIVGYCIGKGFLSGGGPAMAKKFFPRCNEDDYKAIDKGRSAENNKKFGTIIPLLDACFK